MWTLMDRLEAERQNRGLSLREVARRMNQPSASRVGTYLGHRIIPGPDVLRRLCLAIGISPIDAFWQAKYYDAVFSDFENLFRLGWACLHGTRIATTREPSIIRSVERAPSRSPNQWHTPFCSQSASSYDAEMSFVLTLKS